MEYIKDVAKIRLDQGKCTGCEICRIVCPHDVFEISNMKAALVRKNNCIECGACDVNCPVNAIEVESGVGCANALINTWIAESKLNAFSRKFRKDKGSNCC
jgi:NAD-dependent dihydropyrimidine dehydrogenase PreA subunit